MVTGGCLIWVEGIIVVDLNHKSSTQQLPYTTITKKRLDPVKFLSGSYLVVS